MAINLSQKTHLRLIPPAWLLVAIGLLFNIISALLTNFFIDGMQGKISGIEVEKSANQNLISLTWQRVETLERKREMLILLLQTPELTPEISSQIKQSMQPWVGEVSLPKLAVSQLGNWMSLISKLQQQERERIDELYLKNLQLDGTLQHLNEETSQMRNLALFLQIIGLGLILARDLSRGGSAQRNER
ncbi:hypothetical protein [Dongshaea marina]|uniref:hypothetical protein n=1 Tax=Dongshaea marina TaxID=2047966 RepID=UPI000D3E5AD9|nr:hypothetical protein [Dongshaea marina]